MHIWRTEQKNRKKVLITEVKCRETSLLNLFQVRGISWKFLTAGLIMLNVYTIWAGAENIECLSAEIETVYIQ